jgi:hypothetical protein
MSLYMVKWGISLKLVICQPLRALCLFWKRFGRITRVWIIYLILLSAWSMAKGGVKTRDWAKCSLVEEALDFFYILTEQFDLLPTQTAFSFNQNSKPTNPFLTHKGLYPWPLFGPTRKTTFGKFTQRGVFPNRASFQNIVLPIPPLPSTSLFNHSIRKPSSRLNHMLNI